MENLMTLSKTLNVEKSAPELTEADVLAAQTAWGNAIVEISAVYIAGGDYHTKAKELVQALYNFENGPVLFKPTLAAEQPFRNNFEDALSYFVTGHIAEDNGFAIKPWTKVEFAEQSIVVSGGTAFAMGTYFFTPHDTSEDVVRVEYTFGYVKDAAGNLRIFIHHSSLPFMPAG